MRELKPIHMDVLKNIKNQIFLMRDEIFLLEYSKKPDIDKIKNKKAEMNNLIEYYWEIMENPYNYLYS